MKIIRRTLWVSAALLGLVALAAAPASADQVILDDLIVDGSLCVGFDCVNGESFGFDTIRLKENNVRIKFDDTSTSASFPKRDWQLTANATTNGGQEKFSIEDTTAGRTPFTIEGNAPTNSLYVDDSGRLGLGTNVPVVDLHVKSGNTPTLRLEQDGSSGFAAQTWDVAGNEANFFIRDATNGSTLPFRIQPGAASNSLYISNEDEVGINAGTSPGQELHVKDGGDGNTNTALRLESAASAWDFTADNADGNLKWNLVGGGGLNPVISIDDADGSVIITNRTPGSGAGQDACFNTVTGKLCVCGSC